MWYEDKHIKEVMNRHEELRTDKEVPWEEFKARVDSMADKDTVVKLQFTDAVFDVGRNQFWFYGD